MQPRFLSNLILLLGLNLLVKPFYLLVVEAEIQNRVGAPVFGTYFALINFSFILNIIPDLGITNWNTKHIAQHSHLIKKHFAHIFTLRLCLSALFIMVCVVTGLLLNYNREEMGILAVLALAQVLSSLLLYLRSNLAGLHLFRRDSLLSVLDRLLLAAGMATLLWTPLGGERFDIRWLVWGQAISYAIGCLVALAMVLPHAGRLTLSWNPAFLAVVLKQSFPYAALIFLSALAYRMDSVML
ncbi:MAG: oligosaccharide flippase family protein, partial [Flavobacteriales bacterium]|nr:oligosaccharide flippase family protein [Flavobacteriales bacterium]